jgi:hypothetical protein
MIEASTFVEIDGRHWTLIGGTYYVRRPWTNDAWTKPSFVPMAAITMLSPVQRGMVEGFAHGAGSDITNDAPRRRTEPAITVPPTPEMPQRTVDTGWSSYIVPTTLGHRLFRIEETPAQVAYREQREAMMLGGVWSFNEAYDAKAHGAAAYADIAATMEQVRMLAHAAWVRSLPVWQPDETCGDYAARAGILPPKPGKREQWEDSVWLAAAERMAMELSDE